MTIYLFLECAIHLSVEKWKSIKSTLQKVSLSLLPFLVPISSFPLVLVRFKCWKQKLVWVLQPQKDLTQEIGYLQNCWKDWRSGAQGHCPLECQFEGPTTEAVMSPLPLPSPPLLLDTQEASD